VQRRCYWCTIRHTQIKLVNSFNIVILMDSMYKTNKYRMSLLEVVGITSTGLTFSVAFCLLATEKKNNFL